MCDHSRWRCKPNCGKNAPTHNFEEFFKNYVASGSGGRQIPEFNQFFLVPRYICGKIFMKFCSVVFK